ncbi:MAG: SusC/RagA family TonB-linked outer membrane protein [Sphingobacterium sp.]|jgi:TonB-linked SusC/RagA family outer membrane protein|nr:SusC/RagA family TonB-linked outer membrane protein [Sphingobacterium sp.]
MRILLTCVAIGVAYIATAQQILKGRVVDSMGKGVSDVSLKIVTDQRTTISNAEGYFEIGVKNSNGQLIASHIRYQTSTVTFNIQKLPLTIQLIPKENKLDEVGIYHTGYQAIPKERSTGSFAKMGQKELGSRVSGNIMTRIEGLLPGLYQDKRDVGNQLYKFNIRGLNSFTSAMSGPLIVLDNFPFEGSLDLINPEDIESVTVLRDAAAASIWGARAGNGVIVLTSKKGKQGQTTIDVKVNTLATARPDLYYQKVMSSSDFIDVESFLFENGYYNAALNNVSSRTKVFSPVVFTLDKMQKGLISAAEGELYIASLRDRDYRKDLNKYLYRTAVEQQMNIAISSGNAQQSNRLSVSANLRQGEKVGTSGQRITIKNNYDFRLSPKVEINTALSYTFSKELTRPRVPGYPINPGGGKANLYPYAELVDPNGKFLAIPNGYNMRYIDTVASEGLLDWSYKPLEDWQSSKGTSPVQNLLGSFSLQYRPLKTLTLNLNYSVEKETGNSVLAYGAESYFVRDLVNRFTQLTPDGVLRNFPEGEIQNHGTSSMTSHRGRATIAFNRRGGTDHEINVFAGAEISNTRSNSTSFAYYGYNRSTGTTTAIDHSKAYPLILGGTAFFPNSSGISSSVRRFVSFFANGAYTYQDKYTVSLSARRDASNQFGVKTNDLWKPLWSAGIAWNIKKESFLRNEDFVDQLKIRGTYGSAGNSGGRLSTLPVLKYSTVTDMWQGLPFAIVSSLPNERMKWETVNTLNLGIDVGLFKKMQLNVDWYTKESVDLIAPDDIDPTTGFYSINRNIGKISGKGMDMMLSLKDIGNKVRWSVDLSISAVKNIVKSYKGIGSSSYYYASSGGKVLAPTTGRELYPLFAYRFEGLDPANGDPQGWFQGNVSKDYNSLLTDSLQNLKYYGSALPKIFGNFRHSFTYGNWNLSFNIVYRLGHHFLAETIRYTDLFNSWSSHSDFEKRWQKAGDERFTTVPSMRYPASTQRDNFYAVSEANIHPADNVRLQDLQLQYLFKNPFGKVRNIGVYATFSNIGIIWRSNKIGRDPEVGNMPIPFSTALGCTIQF